jgi:hypothetical protein
MPKIEKPANNLERNYESLMDPAGKVKVQDEFANNQEERFQVKNSHFAVFSDKNLSDDEKLAMESNWKIHLSIAPEDIAAAWEIVYPLLHDNATQFKIVDMGRVQKAKERDLQQYEQAKQLKEDFIAKFKHGAGSIDELKAQAAMLCQGREEYGPYLDQREKLIDLLVQKYDARIETAAQILEEDERMLQGMQVTIYIPPGEEVLTYDLAKKIEAKLTQAGIRPGSIYKTDKALGEIVSYRHPGLEYKEAVAASSHNPDNVADPIAKVVAELDRAASQDERERVMHNQAQLASFNKKFDAYHKNYFCRADRRTSLLDKGVPRNEINQQKNQEAKNTVKAIHHELKSINAGELPQDNQLRKLYDLSAKAEQPGAAAHTNFRAVLADMKRLREGKDVMVRMNKYNKPNYSAVNEEKLLTIFLNNLNKVAHDTELLNQQMQGSQFVRDESNKPADIEAFNQNKVFDTSGNLQGGLKIDHRAENNLFDLNTGQLSDKAVMEMSSAINYAYIQTMKELQKQIVTLDSSDPEQAQLQEQLMSYKNDLGYKMVGYLNEASHVQASIPDVKTLAKVGDKVSNTAVTQQENKLENQVQSEKKPTKSWSETVRGLRDAVNDNSCGAWSRFGKK